MYSKGDSHFMQSKKLIISALLTLLFVLSLGCADTPTAPHLTESEIEALIDARVAEGLAKIEGGQADVLSPQDIAQIALKSTVYLRVKTQKKSYYGSGFVVGEGLIATCEHVIEGMTSGTVESVLNDTKYPISAVLAVSDKHDLAIVEVQGFDAPPLPLGDSDTVRVGETVYVTGNPKKLKGTFVRGIVSAIRNEYKGRVIQITAPASPGSSGGAVLNTEATVISVLSETETGGEGLHFAVSVNHLKSLLATIR